ncbi:class I SAM-dependent methyltransferase family protein [Actinomadura macrotermitis]|uniref:SAM-dependent methyltransferase n=1 Tax=Actinomadura macrotermitis TaxID=2585200 RepID=A0A7K0C4P3_9ACTN|nr:class I SAM-dependent methyltransferase family protein [Actinomadura macrotermitis]MQY08413.1 hypothetical protein [Actinomadura macrotermitis]
MERYEIPAQRDWAAWHRAYDDPDSALSRRLRAVQERVAAALDTAPPGPLRAVSLCAGQGRDLIGALARHRRRRDVTARLVELDEANVRAARHAARRAGLEGIEVVAGDASVSDAYAGAVPADLVLLCGVLGNITDADIERLISLLPQLCAAGARVVWTRNRRPPDVTPRILGWFAGNGFEQEWVSPPREQSYGVGAHRFRGCPVPLEPGVRLFTFVGYDTLRKGAPWPT